MSVSNKKSLVVDVSKPMLLIPGSADHHQQYMSGCAVVDVRLEVKGEGHPARQADHFSVSFRNNYTASIAIKAKDGSKWVTILSDRKLMPNCHSSKAGEDFCKINLPKTVVDYTWLRFILRQPSPTWASFGIEDICVTASYNENQTAALPTWLSEESETPTASAAYSSSSSSQMIHSIDDVSSSLQKMWASAEILTNGKEDGPRVRRFDIDGCYDVSLLTYD